MQLFAIELNSGAVRNIEPDRPVPLANGAVAYKDGLALLAQVSILRADFLLPRMSLLCWLRYACLLSTADLLPLKMADSEPRAFPPFYDKNHLILPPSWTDTVSQCYMACLISLTLKMDCVL